MCNLREFVYSILRHWKVLVIISIVSVLAGGSLYYFSCLKGTNASSGTADGAVVHEDWSDLQQLYVGQLKFVGVGNTTVNGEAIRDAYLAEFHGAEFTTALKKHFFENHSLNYVDTLIEVTNANLSNFLGVDVLYYDEEQCRELLNGIIQYVKDINKEMSTGLGEHELFLVVDSVREVDIDDYQTNIELIREAEARGGISKTGKVFSTKKMIIYAILCFLLANLFACFTFIIKDSLGDCVYNSHALTEETDCKVLGDFSGIAITGKIDRLFYNFLIAGKQLTETGVANIVNYKLRELYDEKTGYLLVGNVSRNLLEQKASVLADTADRALSFSVTDIIDEDATFLKQLSEKRVLIYVVQRFKNNRKEVIQNINLYKELGIEVGGILFV